MTITKKDVGRKIAAIGGGVYDVFTIVGVELASDHRPLSTVQLHPIATPEDFYLTAPLALVDNYYYMDEGPRHDKKD